MRILITGTAGFIGYHLVNLLCKEGHEVLGLDNINNYYDVNLKMDRLNAAGISRDQISEIKAVKSKFLEYYQFIKAELEDKDKIQKQFEWFKPEIIIHLAAQAGVRHSLTCPEAYIRSNINGFLNILHCTRMVVKAKLYKSPVVQGKGIEKSFFGDQLRHDGIAGGGIKGSHCSGHQ